MSAFRMSNQQNPTYSYVCKFSRLEKYVNVNTNFRCQRCIFIDGENEPMDYQRHGLPFMAIQRNAVPNRNFFDRSQLKAFADNENKCNLKKEILFGMGGKHCGKRRKCWLPAFSPFPTMFSKAFFSRGVKSRDCVGKS